MKSYILKSKIADNLFAKYYRGGERALDVGSGDGTFPEKFHIFASDITLSEKLKRYKNTLPAFDASTQSIEGRFSLITAWNSVEHMNNPWHFVREVHRALLDGGVFIFSIPNTFSLKNKIGFLCTDEFHRYNKGNDHKVIFTEKTLADFLKGFTVVERNYIGRDGGLAKVLILKKILVGKWWGETMYVVAKKH